MNFLKIMSIRLVADFSLCAHNCRGSTVDDALNFGFVLMSFGAWRGFKVFIPYLWPRQSASRGHNQQKKHVSLSIPLSSFQ